jgi:hypothetical protein
MVAVAAHVCDANQTERPAIHSIRASLIAAGRFIMYTICCASRLVLEATLAPKDTDNL